MSVFISEFNFSWYLHILVILTHNSTYDSFEVECVTRHNPGNSWHTGECRVLLLVWLPWVGYSCWYDYLESHHVKNEKNTRKIRKETKNSKKLAFSKIEFATKWVFTCKKFFQGEKSWFRGAFSLFSYLFAYLVDYVCRLRGMVYIG